MESKTNHASSTVEAWALWISVALHLKLSQSCPGGYRVFFGRLQIAPPIPRAPTNHHETSRQLRLSDFPGDPTKLKYVQNKFSMILAPHSKMSQLSASEPHSRCARFVCKPDFCMSDYLYIKQVVFEFLVFISFLDLSLSSLTWSFSSVCITSSLLRAVLQIPQQHPESCNWIQSTKKNNKIKTGWILWILFWLLTVLDQSWPLWGSNVIAVFRSVSYAIHTELTLNPSKLSTSWKSLRIKLLTPMTKSLKNQRHIENCLCIQSLKFVPPVMKYLKIRKHN